MNKFKELAAHIENMRHSTIILYLSAIFWIWRLLTLNVIEKSGDAVWRWSFLRYYLVNGVWFPEFADHHQGRWAVNMPIYFFMRIFRNADGDVPLWTYYIVPLLTAFGCALLVYYVTMKLGRSKLAGISAFMLVLFFPLAVRESGQILPMLPAVFFILCAFAMMIRHIETSKLMPLFLAGIFAGLSYGCKFTSLYWPFAFALFIMIWPVEKKRLFHIWKFNITPGVLILSCGLVTVLVLETFILNRIFDVSLGRVEIIAGTHLEVNYRAKGVGIFAYLLSIVRPFSFSGKYFDMVPELMIFGSGVIFCIFLLFKGNRLQKLAAFSFAVAYVLHCYMVYKVFPFMYPERAIGRYFLILAFFSFIMTTSAWSDFGKYLESRGIKQNIIRGVGFVFVVVLAVIMVIRPVNLFLNGDNIITIEDNSRTMRYVAEKKIPLLYRMRGKDKFNLDGGDAKVERFWRAVYGSASEIPSLYEEMKHRLVKDESGRFYACIMNAESVTENVPSEVVIADDYMLEKTILSLSDAGIVNVDSKQDYMDETD